MAHGQEQRGCQVQRTWGMIPAHLRKGEKAQSRHTASILAPAGSQTKARQRRLHGGGDLSVERCIVIFQKEKHFKRGAENSKIQTPRRGWVSYRTSNIGEIISG